MKLSEQNFKEWLMGMMMQNFYGGFETLDAEKLKEYAPKLKKTAEEIISFAKEHKIFEA